MACGVNLPFFGVRWRPRRRVNVGAVREPPNAGKARIQIEVRRRANLVIYTRERNNFSKNLIHCEMILMIVKH